MTDEPRVFGDRDKRLFGVVLGGILAALAARSRWKGGAAWPWLAVAALLFAGTGALAPAALTPVFKVWMRFALVMGAINTFLLMTAIFVLIFTPAGLWRRLFGRREPPRESYWDAKGAARPREDYTRQF